MALKAAFFDVGDTLVEHWAPGEVMNAKTRARICAELGDPEWLDDWLAADIEPTPDVSLVQALVKRSNGPSRFEPESSRQETEHWYRRWFDDRGVDVSGLDLDRLRALMCVPLDEISTPVRGAFDAVRWCAERRLRVVLVTNTLSRGDEEVLEDWRRFGIGDAIHGVVSSHSVGWRKPHPAIFERALEIAGVRPEQAFHVGDNLVADVWGARQLGIRAVWRRSGGERPSSLASERRMAASACRHPSQDLVLESGKVGCRGCGEPAGIDVRPDAVVDDLTEVPAVVTPWLDAA